MLAAYRLLLLKRVSTCMKGERASTAELITRRHEDLASRDELMEPNTENEAMNHAELEAYLLKKIQQQEVPQESKRWKPRRRCCGISPRGFGARAAPRRMEALDSSR